MDYFVTQHKDIRKWTLRVASDVSLSTVCSVIRYEQEMPVGSIIFEAHKKKWIKEGDGQHIEVVSCWMKAE